MGWAGSTDVVTQFISDLKRDNFSFDSRRRVYYNFIRTLEENADADTLDECCEYDEAFRQAYEELHPADPDDVERPPVVIPNMLKAMQSIVDVAEGFMDYTEDPKRHEDKLVDWNNHIVEVVMNALYGDDVYTYINSRFR